MNGLVRELSRELARYVLDLQQSTDLTEEQLAQALFERTSEWLDGKDVQGLMLKVLAGKLG